MTRDELIDKVTAGTSRERERRGLTPAQVPREVYVLADDVQLMKLAAEIDVLDQLYQSDRSAWERYAEKRMKELGVIKVPRR